MMASVVKNKAILKQRVLRLLSPKNDPSKKLHFFLNSVSKQADVFLFGGAIRDVALHGVSKFSSDLDFVFDGSADELDNLLSGYSASKNKFGGYRLKIVNIDIDIWALENTWAFKHGHVKCESIKSILKTTIVNWDACLFSWKKKRLFLSETYVDNLKKGYLDLVLKENPNRLGLLVRVLRYYAEKDANYLSSQLVDLISKELQKYSVGKILEYEHSSYKCSYISERLIVYIEKSIELNVNGILPTELEKFNTTKDLFK